MGWPRPGERGLDRRRALGELLGEQRNLLCSAVAASRGGAPVSRTRLRFATLMLGASEGRWSCDYGSSRSGQAALQNRDRANGMVSQPGKKPFPIK